MEAEYSGPSTLSDSTSEPVGSFGSCRSWGEAADSTTRPGGLVIAPADTSSWHAGERIHPSQMQGARLAGRGPTSFLKRQKEQQRTARAAAKRAARQARRDSRVQENAAEVPDEASFPEAVDPTPESDN